MDISVIVRQKEIQIAELEGKMSYLEQGLASQNDFSEYLTVDEQLRIGGLALHYLKLDVTGRYLEVYGGKE